MNVAAEVAELVDVLQLRYCAALDSRDMPAWLATFAETPEAAYVCTSAANVEAGLSIAMMLDDCRGRLEDRVMFITKVWAGTFQDYRTRHFVQRMSLAAAGAGDFAVRSHFHIGYVSDDGGEPRVLATGVYEDVVRIVAGDARFLSKRAITDNESLPRYVVYPL